MRVSRDELDRGLDGIRQAPAEEGRVEMLVRRPSKDEREEMPELEFVEGWGVLGDAWRSPQRHADPADPGKTENEITLMGARAVALVAGERERWKLAGDQCYVDFDLSEANVPPGTRLVLGEVELEVTALPHLGCRKFRERFGPDALEWVNSPVGRDLHLRGINARIIRGGRVRVGDSIRKVR